MTTAASWPDWPDELELFRGDLVPHAVMPISGASGDLNTVESWRVVGRMDGTPSTEPPTVVDTNPGHVVDPSDSRKATITHTWADGETDTAGVMRLEVEGTYPGGVPQTFGTVTVRIKPDLG